MFKYIRNKFAALVAVATLAAVPLAIPAVSFAAADIQSCLSQGSGLSADISDSGDCTKAPDTGGADLNSIVTMIVNIFSIVVGVVAVIMIIVGGFRYITSGGDSNNISGAKNTIIYAIVGLIIVALAQFIVKFVLDKVTSNT